MDLVLAWVDNKVVIERPKMSVFKTILSYFDITDKEVRFGRSDLHINNDDVIDVMLEEQASDFEILKTAKTFGKDYEFGKSLIFMF